MGHNFGQAVIVISFDPDHFNFTLGIGKLANEAEKFPVFLLQSPEIEVGKNIAQQNKAAVLILLENAQCLARAAHVRSEVQIRKDQRVMDLRGMDLRGMDLRGHVLIVAQKCYEVINWETVEAPGVICE